MDKLKQKWQSDIVECVVHIININEVDDPDLFIAAPIIDWQQTESGKWIMKHSNPTPVWQRLINYNTWSCTYAIKAYLTPEQLTYWKLKFE